MRWGEALQPVVMERVALLAPQSRLREVLAVVADEGTVEVDLLQSDADPTATGPSGAALQRLSPATVASVRLARTPPDPDAWERGGRVDLLAGEAQIEARAAQAVRRGRVAGLVGWAPADSLPLLARRLAEVGGVVVPLARPAGSEPPTMLPPSGASRGFAPLVDTYATVPYADLNPSVVAGLAYVLMFGMMFADAGEGAVLVGLAFAVRSRRWARLSRLEGVWLFLAGAGAASIVFGALYGEFFGPTGVLPVLWLAPLDHPVTLLLAAVGVGAVLLALAYALGTVNRFREGGWRLALWAPTGIAGSTLFVGLGMGVAGVSLGRGLILAAAVVVTVVGLGLAFLGLLLAAGGGLAAGAQATIELVDLVMRIGSNLVSFARLAAFGLTHAALGLVVWQATTAMWGQGVAPSIAAAGVFVVGTAVAFALEGLVAAIQALRLEYYELFSRVFDGEGRPFRPWHVPFEALEPLGAPDPVDPPVPPYARKSS